MRRLIPVGLSLLFCLVPGPPALGNSIEGYRLVGQFTLPAGTAAFDVLPDGRIIAISGTDIHLEAKLGSRVFAALGSLPDADIPGFGAAFLSVSPDGEKFAVGNNGGLFGDNFEVGIFNSADLSGTWFSAGHFDGAWIDDTQVALTYGDFVDPSIVSILDATSPDPQNPNNRIVIGGIGGASAGICFDAAGTLFTGNGFAFEGPSGTGVVRAFAPASWQAAWSSQSPLDFESQGDLIVEILSASPLRFDLHGNLLAGGGDFGQSGHTGFGALVAAAAVSSALAGKPVDAEDPEVVRRLDPAPGNHSEFYTVSQNRATAEIYLRDAGSQTVHVFLDVSVVPAATAWGLGSLAICIAIAATLMLGKTARRQVSEVSK